jgi:hypothetical protein
MDNWLTQRPHLSSFSKSSSMVFISQFGAPARHAVVVRSTCVRARLKIQGGWTGQLAAFRVLHRQVEKPVAIMNVHR